jgi:hypothetical protein
MIRIGEQSILFISVGPDHVLYGCSPEGKLISKFGQKGKGSGDLYFPGDLSVLDGRYLVIGEYATSLIKRYIKLT